MKKYFFNRTLTLIPTFIGIMIVLGIMFIAMPGNYADGTINQKVRIKLIQKYHFNQPKTVQYLYWFKNFMKGDMGIVFTNAPNENPPPVAPIVNAGAKNTLTLMLFSIITSIIIAIPLGTTSAARDGTKKQKTIKFLSILGISLPSFVVAMLLYRILRYNPIVSNYCNNPDSYSIFLSRIVPYLVLTTIFSSKLTKYVYISILDTIHNEYITVAKCYGFKEKKILYKYSLKNALIPIVTIIGTSFPELFSDVIVMEIAVNGYGLGSLLISGIFTRQYYGIMATMSIIALIVLISNYLLDILLYGIIDPRTKNRLQKQNAIS